MNRKPNNHRANKFANARRWARQAGCTAALLHAVAGHAVAGPFDSALGDTKYVTMTGDVNGDGQNDVLMKAVPKFVAIPIDDDLDVPIPIPPRSATFLLLSTGYGTYTLVTNPDTQTIGWPGWTMATQQLAYAGPNGAFAGSVTITAAAPDQASFVVSMAADTGLLQITSVTPPAWNSAPAVPGNSPSSTEKYAYDALGRLRKVTSVKGEQIGYDYDRAGNRTLSSITVAGSTPPAQGVFGYVRNGGHSSNGTSGDLITFTVTNTGSGTINSVTATCSGGSFHNIGMFSSATLAPGATGTIQCRAAASGAYSAAKVTMSGTNATNTGVIFGPY